MPGLLDWVEPARDWVNGRIRKTNALAEFVGDLAMDRGEARNSLANAIRSAPKFQVPEQMDESALAFWNPAGLLGKIVYHGSPHKFDKFDASKIGTGEGAQAYGHGVYLADAPEVALQYSNMRAAPNMEFYAGPKKLTGLEKAIADDLTANGKSAAFLNAKANGPEWLAAYERIANEPVTRGSLYKADLPDEWIPKMLDWDKPLNEAPEQFRALLSGHARYADQNIVGKTKIGEAIGELAGVVGGRAQASAKLREAGFPGIRYLDGGSRSAGQGSYNYVVFPGLEDQVKILERNGVPIK